MVNSEDESSENEDGESIVQEINTQVVVTNPYGVNELYYLREKIPDQQDDNTLLFACCDWQDHCKNQDHQQIDDIGHCNVSTKNGATSFDSS